MIDRLRFFMSIAFFSFFLQLYLSLVFLGCDVLRLFSFSPLSCSKQFKSIFCDSWLGVAAPIFLLFQRSCSVQIFFFQISCGIFLGPRRHAPAFISAARAHIRFRCRFSPRFDVLGPASLFLRSCSLQRYFLWPLLTQMQFKSTFSQFLAVASTCQQLELMPPSQTPALVQHMRNIR